MLSFVCTLATSAWKRFSCFRDADAPSCLRIAVTSRRVYQTSRLRICAKRMIASRYARAAAITTERQTASIEAAIATRDRDARGEPLHVPLEWPRKRLVEVVDAEDEPSIGCREDAEIGEVCVSAELCVQARPRPIREIGRHQVGGAAEERERRDEHAPVPDRGELRQTGLPLLLEEIHGIRASRQRLPGGVGRARQLAARGLASGGPLGGREVWHRLPRRPPARRCILVQDVLRGILGRRRRTCAERSGMVSCGPHGLTPFAALRRSENACGAADSRASRGPLRVARDDDPLGAKDLS